MARLTGSQGTEHQWKRIPEPHLARWWPWLGGLQLLLAYQASTMASRERNSELCVLPHAYVQLHVLCGESWHALRQAPPQRAAAGAGQQGHPWKGGGGAPITHCRE
jgi:hypothetical protein